MTTTPTHPSLVTLTDPRSPVSEAYRTLRINIQFSSLDRPLRSLVITGVDPGEGKTTTLANLAVVMAQAGTRVIAVDCDLRRPTLHHIFGLDNSRGVTTMMLEQGGAPPLQESGVAGLRILTSGPRPPSPGELLASRRMEEILRALLAEADILLLDTPPVVAVSDALVLATRVDGVVLVLNAGKTKRDLARRARALLEKVNARILGVVLNNAPVDASIYRYYQQVDSSH